MGAYLDHPQRDKTSVNDVGRGIRFGASSMQGWRISQEDAHNCCPDFDPDASSALFAVYDGHGGGEVAEYVSMHFPNFLKEHQLYKEGKIEEALQAAFLDFDELLAKEKTVEELVALAGIEPDENEDDEEEEAAMLCEEAELPLEKVLERYSQSGKAEPPPMLDKNRKFQSPFIRGKKSASEVADVNTTGDGLAVKLEEKLSNGHTENDIVDSGGDAKCCKTQKVDNECSEPRGDQNDKVSSSECEAPSKSEVTDDDGVVSSSSCSKEETEAQDPAEDTLADSTCSSTTHSKDEASLSTSNVNIETKTSATKVDVSPLTANSSTGTEPSSSSGRTRKKRQGVIPEEGEDESSFDEEEEDTDEEDGGPLWASDDEDDDDDDSDDAEETGDGDEDEDSAFFGAGDQPGTDSGCTAVVALLRNRTLFVANAGDSRCVLCRGGVATDMSEDHKPEDDAEQARINKAGGRVTLDGRVNGGLNLSRALGDHVYKQNEDLSASEQMISALPDVKSLELQDNDEFLILACDGIWNVLSSQDSVDFVRSRIQAGNINLSSIVEEMFEFCLAPDTAGDGSGCDNMTCIILTFDPFGTMAEDTGGKRKAETSGAEVSDSDVKQDSKRTKIEEEDSLPPSSSS